MESEYGNIILPARFFQHMVRFNNDANLPMQELVCRWDWKGGSIIEHICSWIWKKLDSIKIDLKYAHIRIYLTTCNREEDTDICVVAEIEIPFCIFDKDIKYETIPFNPRKLYNPHCTTIEYSLSNMLLKEYPLKDYHELAIMLSNKISNNNNFDKFSFQQIILEKRLS